MSSYWNGKKLNDSYLGELEGYIELKNNTKQGNVHFSK